MPERLEVTLAPKTPALARRPAGRDRRRRRATSTARRAPSSTSRARSSVQAAATSRRSRASTASRSASRTRRSRRRPPRSRSTARPTRKGASTMTVPVQELAAPRPTEAKITLRVGEEGGRAVERSVTLPILPKGRSIGVRKNFGGDLAEGATATFDVVLAAPDGTRLARQGVAWNLYKVERRYQWFNRTAAGASSRSSRRAASPTAASTSRPPSPARIAAPVEWGTYRLDVRADGVETAQTSVSFTVGWSRRPDRRHAGPPRHDARQGELRARARRSRARLSPRFAGKATLAVVSDKVHDIRVVDVAADGTTVTLPVKAEWGAGAYLVALAHRPARRGGEAHCPAARSALAWFEVDRARAHAHGRARRAGADAAARRRCACRSRSPGSRPARRRASPSRRSMSASSTSPATRRRTRSSTSSARSSSRPRSATSTATSSTACRARAARSAPAATTARGVAGHPADAGAARPLFRRGQGRAGRHRRGRFDIPAFNGTVRVMAVAWTRDRVGSASADVIVRDPVVARRHAAALPRRSATSRASTCRSTTSRGRRPSTRSTSTCAARCVAAGRRAAQTHPARGRRARAPVTIPVTAAGPGLAVVDVKLTGPNIEAAQSFALARAARHLRRSCAAPCGRSRPGASLTVSSDLLADILPGTGAVSVSVSPLAALDVPGLLQALDRYPYGCSEQIVSRALPLLYVNRLAATRGARRSTPRLDERVRDAIERVLARQDSNGAFGLWSRRRRRHLARRLRHRLPDPGARAQLRGAAARLRPRARPPAQLRRQHDRGRRRTAPISPMRPMCWPATAGR